MNGACIIASNHESYLDFLCFSAVSPRPIHYLAAEKFFEHPVWKLVMCFTGSLRVDRHADTKVGCFKAVLTELRNGKMIGIFPEGTRSATGKLLRGKPGVAQLALKARVPVIPVGIIGAYEVMSRNDRFPRISSRITLKVGEPLHFEELYGRKVDKETLQEVTDHIMLKIAALTQEEYPYAATPTRTAGFGLT
jgi:1-acyl-sn-glycerol-3-phosphate acyltransferase